MDRVKDTDRNGDMEEDRGVNRDRERGGDKDTDPLNVKNSKFRM
jgi:hypothetical protein